MIEGHKEKNGVMNKDDMRFSHTKSRKYVFTIYSTLFVLIFSTNRKTTAEN